MINKVLECLNAGKSFEYEGVLYECHKNKSEKWLKIGVVTIFFDEAVKSDEFREDSIVLIKEIWVNGGEYIEKVRKAEILLNDDPPLKIERI